MEIINIIESKNGIQEEPKSFVVFPNATKKERDEVYKKAEDLFCELVKTNNESITDEELEEALDNGCYDNNSGYEILINESIIQK